MNKFLPSFLTEIPEWISVELLKEFLRKFVIRLLENFLDFLRISWIAGKNIKKFVVREGGNSWIIFWRKFLEGFWRIKWDKVSRKLVQEFLGIFLKELLLKVLVGYPGEYPTVINKGIFRGNSWMNFSKKIWRNSRWNNWKNS